MIFNNKLAINGGSPTIREGTIKPWPNLSSSTLENIKVILKAKDISKERWTQLNALAGVGVSPGDEVLVPAYTYWATAAAVLQQYAIPIFVDINLQNYCIDPNLIEDASQAHGSTYKGKKCGSLADVAAFSLEMSKPLTSGSVGGLLVTNKKKIAGSANDMRKFNKKQSRMDLSE